MTKKVSVIMPVFNVEDYLEESIKTVLSQSYTNFEFIIVDDGSTDGSAEIIDRYAKKDKRIVAIHQKNSGAAAARNTGLDNATGELVSFVDSDDRLRKDFIKALVESIISNNAQLAVCNFETFGVDNPPSVKVLKPGEVSREQAIKHCLGYNSFNGYVWNKIFVLNIIRDNAIRFEDGYFPNEDVLFVGKYIYFCKKVSILTDELYLYRQNNTGGNRGRFSGVKPYDPKCLNTLKATKSLREFYKDNDISKYCTLHDVRETGLILRSMVAGNYFGKEYSKLKKLIRKKALRFYFSSEANATQKFSVFLTAVSPKLELKVWKRLNKV